MNRCFSSLHNVKVVARGRGIMSLILNDPENYNALSLKTLNSIGKALTTLNADPSTKVIILEGSGKGFSAGHNLKELNSYTKELDKNEENSGKLFATCSKVMLEIVQGHKPVIAKVHGAAFAAGLQLVASCDLAYSTEDAKFATPGVNIGLFCSTPMVALSRNIHQKHAMSMLLTGEPITAWKAKEIGLINDFYSSKVTLDENILSVAEKIASKSTSTIQLGKHAFYKQCHMPLHDAYNFTETVMTNNLISKDAKEGITAFLEKRRPSFNNL